MHALQQRLADTLRDAAVHLPFDDHRVDDVAEVVGRDELHDLGLARFRIDLDLADVAAGREGEVGRIVESGLLQARFHAGGQVVSGVRGERHLEPGQRLVRAGHLQLAVLDDDVAFVGLHQMRGDLLRLRLHLVERLDDRRHADRTRTGTISAHAHLHLVGIAMDDGDAVDRHAEPAGNQLREGRLVPLPVAVRAGEHFDRSHSVHPHLGRFP